MCGCMCGVHARSMHGARSERYTLPAAAVSAIVAAIWSSWPVSSFISMPSREGALSAIASMSFSVGLGTVKGHTR